MSITKRKTQKREREIASEIGGRAVPASGAFLGSPGDVKNDAWLYEVKQTEKKSYSLSLKVLRKMTQEAFSVDRKPILLVSFEEGVARDEFVVLPRRIFDEMVEDIE